jgi:predicted HicB family RNase H-like nuclease
MNTMTYKGYAARIEYSEEDECLVGHLLGIRSIVGFDATSVTELRKRFRAAVDHYLEASKTLGLAPEKPFSGRMMLRVSPNLHARASAAAQVKGVSLNQWAARALEQAAESS